MVNVYMWGKPNLLDNTYEGMPSYFLQNRERPHGDLNRYGQYMYEEIEPSGGVGGVGSCYDQYLCHLRAQKFCKQKGQLSEDQKAVHDRFVEDCTATWKY